MTLKNLLNTLYERGWKPRGEREPIYILSSKKLYIPDTMEEVRSLRDLVSKESGLWQFVCENGMININNEFDYEEWGKYYKWNGDENEYTHIFSRHCDIFWLLESALKDESELEEFLLDNIKIDEKYTEEEQELIDLDYGTGYTKKFVK